MSTAQQLQRALEERAKEIVQLQNELQRAEADRLVWKGFGFRDTGIILLVSGISLQQVRML